MSISREVPQKRNNPSPRMRSFTILVVLVVVAGCASLPVDRVQQVGGQAGQAVQGQEHRGHLHVPRPGQNYSPVGSGHLPGNVVHGVHGQYVVSGVQGAQGRHGVQGGQGAQPVHVVHEPQQENPGGGVLIEHGQVVPIGIIAQDSEVNPDGTFHNVWESENGIKVQEQASVKLARDNTVSQTVTGQISYFDNEGKQVLLTYVADETGFHPEGDHLPTPPPIPTGIARGLEWIRAHPSTEEPKVPEQTVFDERTEEY